MECSFELLPIEGALAGAYIESHREGEAFAGSRHAHWNSSSAEMTFVLERNQQVLPKGDGQISKRSLTLREGINRPRHPIA